MPLDGITCELISLELNEKLRGMRIDKIFQPDKYTVMMHIRTSEGNKKLLISFDPSAPRIHFTEQTRENPQMPPSFCMLLRKYMQGAKITEITCPDYERIVEISFATIDELHDTKNMRLIIELMGRYSNLILVNAQDRIIDSAIHVDFSISRVREVMPARIYEYPPAQDKINCDNALKILNNGDLPILESETKRPVAKALLNSIKGFSPLIVNTVIARSDIDDKKSVSILDPDEISRLNNTLKDLLTSVESRNIAPCAAFTSQGEAREYTYTLLTGFDKVISTKSMSEALDRFYASKEANIDFENKRRTLLSIVGNALVHAAKKYEIHMSDLEEGRKADEYRMKGDIILCNAYSIEPKAESITCTNIYDELQRDITIKLDPSLDASSNAQEYFRLFRKAKRKFEVSEEYIKDDELAIDYLRSLKSAILSAATDEDIEACREEVQSEIVKDTGENRKKVINNGDPNKTVGVSKSGKASSRALRSAAKAAAAKKNRASGKEKNKKALSYRHFYTSDGYECFCGRNNIQNDRLTFGVADKNDWWFHVKDTPGTHVIVKSKIGEEFPSDTAVIEAAQAAAFYSRSIMIEERSGVESQGHLKAEIDYCPVSHVKKIPKAKPGMVIYEGYYSILVDAVEPSKFADD